MHNDRPFSVYLAGPIQKMDWRHKIVPGLREKYFDETDKHGVAKFDTSTEMATITEDVVCVGPWFVACDHGCFHGPGSHGALGGLERLTPKALKALLTNLALQGLTQEGIEDCPAPGNDNNRQTVFHTSIAQIRRSDAVFCYVDRKGAYGTNFELGYAHALEIPIFVSFSDGQRALSDDMWFAAMAGVGSHGGDVGPVEVLWERFCIWLRTTGYRQTLHQAHAFCMNHHRQSTFGE